LDWRWCWTASSGSDSLPNMELGQPQQTVSPPDFTRLRAFSSIGVARLSALFRRPPGPIPLPSYGTAARPPPLVSARVRLPAASIRLRHGSSLPELTRVEPDRGLLMSGCDSGGEPRRFRSVARPAIRASGERCWAGTVCRLRPRWAEGRDGTRPPNRARLPAPHSG